jgi:hypothetical protein
MLRQDGPSRRRMAQDGAFNEKTVVILWFGHLRSVHRNRMVERSSKINFRYIGNQSVIDIAAERDKGVATNQGRTT